jgi:DNA invertase Pin-like site-specific DNA recombinase
MANRRKRIYQGALPTARRAVLYARYSDEQQRDSWSIDAQVAELRAYCARMGWTVCDEICIDEAITGKTEDRPGLARAMALIREGKANVLVVHKLDRFFRNMAKTFEYVAELEEYGAGLVCTQQPIDTTNPVSGKIVLAVMAALAEIFLDNLAEEVSKGKRARAAAGLPNGDLPYGYCMPPLHSSNPMARRVPQILAEEAAAVRLAYELYATGQYGDAKIAHALNDRGYRIRSKRHPDGWRFTKDTVSAMLMNCFYAGWVVQPTDEATTWANRSKVAPRVRGQHQPIISQELYDQVQVVRARRAPKEPSGVGRRGGARRQRHAAYIAAGLVRCHICGMRLRAQGGARRRPHYRCSWHERGGECATRRKSVDAAYIDGILGSTIADLRLRPEWRQEVLDALDANAEDAARLMSERTAILRRMERIKALLIDGDLTQQEYRSEKMRLDAELARLAPPPERVNAEQAAALLDNLAAVWEQARDEERKALAAQVIDAVYCDPDRPGDVFIVLAEGLHPVWEALPRCTTWVTDGPRPPVFYHVSKEAARLAA